MNTQKMNREIKSLLIKYIGEKIESLEEIKQKVCSILWDNGYPEDAIVPGINFKMEHKNRSLAIFHKPTINSRWQVIAIGPEIIRPDRVQQIPDQV